MASSQRLKNVLFVLSVVVLALASVAVCTFVHAQAHKALFNENEYKSYLKFLADDMLEGRSPGARGGDLSALYIASQFEAAGLRAFSEKNGYFQQVPLQGFSPDFRSLDFKLGTNDKSKTLTPVEDVVVSSEIPQEKIHLEEELIFVGYGVDAPEYDWDDFKNVDVKGKTLVMLAGDPDYNRTGFGSEHPTYYNFTMLYKKTIARIKGAKGLIIIHSDDTSLFPFSHIAGRFIPEILISDQMLMNPLSFYAYISKQAMDAALSLEDLSFDLLKKMADSRDFHPFPLGIKAEISFRQRFRKVKSPNVVGFLPGTSSDEEAVIYMAHYDHLGIRRPVKGDSIYNGARDNASGTAALISLARAFSVHPTKRRVIFLATTAEESWLLGSRHYVSNPLFPLEKTAIALNIDTFSFFGRTDGFEMFPIQYTNAVQTILKLGQELGLELHYGLPDPQGIAFRSDAFPFCMNGVVALSFWQTGKTLDLTKQEIRNLSKKVGITKISDWVHKPNDEIYPFWRYEGIVQSLELLYHVGQYYANNEEIPNFIPENPYNTPRRVKEMLAKEVKSLK